MISIPIGIKTHKQKSARKPAIGVKTRFYVEGGEPGFGRRVFMGFDGLDGLYGLSFFLINGSWRSCLIKNLVLNENLVLTENPVLIIRTVFFQELN